MLSSRIFRLIHSDIALWQKKNQSLLAELRKKTGYTFSNCKKALELHGNDLAKAEQWLKEQAQAHGWSQAAKFEGRKTAEGVIAAIADKNNGVLLEINCETDFVARNKTFQSLAETITTTVFKHTATLSNDKLLNKQFLYSDTLKALPAMDGKSLGDHTALTIGSVGENIIIKRATCLSTNSDVQLYGCTHPISTGSLPVSFGKYGALIALQASSPQSSLGPQLCQHIIGMNPLKVGDAGLDVPHNDTEQEPCLIFQDFLLNPTVSVQRVLLDSNVKVLDFIRFEIGELKGITEKEKNIDAVETCG
ncbi:elongation factor Ts, mitochondrial [Prorops nasuta]|uniref:elongation factor Ts, mitochondrial n=1 Tax=Prorops nasuta TaxID=863751 RepID=UPI0034CDDBEC